MFANRLNFACLDKPNELRRDSTTCEPVFSMPIFGIDRPLNISAESLDLIRIMFRRLGCSNERSVAMNPLPPLCAWSLFA